VSGTNTRAGYACTGNAPIGLVGIRGKTCFGKTCLGGKIARTLRNFLDRAAHQNKFYRECQPTKYERYPCTRSQHGSLRLTRGKKIIFTNVEVDWAVLYCALMTVENDHHVAVPVISLWSPCTDIGLL